jgi:hypothetical protein
MTELIIMAHRIDEEKIGREIFLNEEGGREEVRS